MPCYVYSCKECGHETEMVMDITAKKYDTIKCRCGKRAERKISLPRFNLVGEGWASKPDQKKYSVDDTLD